MPAPDPELHPDALEDALAGYAWYLERSPRVADAFFAELERALRLIRIAPERWPLYLFGARHYVLRKYPYSVVYKATGDTIVIYAFAHAKRRPGYWKSRLGWKPPTGSGGPSVRPVSPKETPKAMKELCLGYGAAIEQAVVPPLVTAAALILDFLCIHPFRDGNGRVSRLLTLLALYRHGHAVGRYVSTERLVEDAKEDYYEALRRSSQRWHEGKHDFAPWLAFFLTIVRPTWSSSSGRERCGHPAAPRRNSSRRPSRVSTAPSASQTWNGGVRA